MSAAFTFALAVTAESASRWHMARDGAIAPAPQAPLPLSYFVFLRAQPILGKSIHAMLDRDPDRGLYGGVSYRLARRPRPGARLDAEAVVRSRKRVDSPRGELTVTTLDTTYRDGAEACLTETVRMIDLPARGRDDRPPPAPEPRAARYPKLADVPALDRRRMAWMAVETGDMNRLHFDPAYAKGRGFRDVVVPAPLITATLERLIGAHFATAVAEIDVRFHAPSFPDEAMTLHGAAEGDGLAFELFAGGVLRADGRASPGEATVQ